MDSTGTKREKKSSIDRGSQKFVEGVDFYFENGLMVLTGHFLKRRGYCCDNGCRHCPFPKTKPAKS